MLMDILIVGFWLFAAYGIYLMITGQDPESQLAHDVARLKQKNKTKLPIIYLRSFDSEKLHFSDIKGAFNGNVLPGTGDYWKDVGDIVTGYLSVIGPVYALDRPEKTFRLRSAAITRPELFSADNDHWQKQILEWLSKAKLVVVQLDATSGLEWEITQVVQRISPTKVLLVLPPTQVEYEKIWQGTSHLFPNPLPVKLVSTRVLTFWPDWQPRPLEMTAAGGDFSLWQTLEPVFDQNGYEKPAWRRIYGFGEPR